MKYELNKVKDLSKIAKGKEVVFIDGVRLNDKKCSVCGGGKNIDDGDNCYHVCEHCWGTGIEPVKVECKHDWERDYKSQVYKCLLCDDRKVEIERIKVEPETQLSELDKIIEKNIPEFKSHNINKDINTLEEERQRGWNICIVQMCANKTKLKCEINEWHKQEMVKLIDERIAIYQKIYDEKVNKERAIGLLDIIDCFKIFKDKILQGKSK